MPKAARPIRHEEAQSGEIVWLETGVEFGHDGIKNLVHWVPLAQNDWKLFSADDGHDLVFDFDSATSRITARQQAIKGGTRTSQIRMRVILPRDFGAFETGALVFVTRRGADSPTSYEATILKDGAADPGVNGADILPAAASVFELQTLTPTAAYAPGDFITLEIELVTDDDGDFAEIADIELLYRTARGNV